jgi:hypothetical protein
MLSLALFFVSVSGQWSLSIRFLFTKSFLDIRALDLFGLRAVIYVYLLGYLNFFTL